MFKTMNKCSYRMVAWLCGIVWILITIDTPGCLYFLYMDVITIAGLARSGVQGATADRKGAEVGTGTPRYDMALKTKRTLKGSKA